MAGTGPAVAGASSAAAGEVVREPATGTSCWAQAPSASVAARQSEREMLRVGRVMVAPAVGADVVVTKQDAAGATFDAAYGA